MSERAVAGLLIIPSFVGLGYFLYKALSESKHKSYIIEETETVSQKSNNASSTSKRQSSSPGDVLSYSTESIWDKIKSEFKKLTTNEVSKYPFDPDKVVGSGCIRYKDSILVSGRRAMSLILRYRNIAEKYGDFFGVPPALILAVIATESSGNPYARRYEPAINDSSLGLMQMLCRTAYGLGLRGSCSQLYNPEISIKYGAMYLRKQYDRYGNWLDAIAAYNAGRARHTGYRCWFNQNYVNKVVSWMKVLKDYGYN